MPPRRTRRDRPVTVATLVGILSLFMPAVSCLRIYFNNRSLLLFGYTCTMSALAFLLYGYDKMQARHLEWRVKETTLHLLGLLGGWPGALAGMHFFQHKTRKITFQVPFWITILIWQIVWLAIWNGDLAKWEVQTNIRT